MDFIDEYLDGYRYFGHWSSNKKRGNQYKVRSKKEVIEYLEEHNGRDNCGISISTFVHGMPKLLYLPFDFDSDDIQKAFEDAYKLYKFFSESDYNCMLNSSGGKGFHVLVETVPKTYGKKQLRNIQMFFKKTLGLTTSDEHIMSDMRRLIRIPGTYHVKGTMCYTIFQNVGHKQFDISEYSSPDEHEYTPEDFKRYESKNGRIYHDYPCVELHIKDPEPRQIIRFAWVVEQLKDEVSEEDMLDFAQEYWIDYNPDYCLYQIRHIESGNYVHPTCETLQDMGFCIGEECPHYKPWKGIRNV